MAYKIIKHYQLLRQFIRLNSKLIGLQELKDESLQPVALNVRYKEAVARLNSLQSNAVTQKKLRTEKEYMLSRNVPETMECFKKCQIKLEDIDNLNVIHVAGTKGKGSTCAFVESILRQYNLKTGFYSSPHMVHVRERIRINGMPLSENDFVKYFNEVYKCLSAEPEEDFNMPAYFKFLTVLAFHVFIKQKVDVAIIEVGIGGEQDCTNIIQNPVVCGITTLDYDHTHILGNTIESIARQKAGIFKNGSPAVTSPQVSSAMDVLVAHAKKINCSLNVAPKLDSYLSPLEKFGVNIKGEHQKLNISLAFELAKIWLTRVIFLNNRNGIPSIRWSKRDLEATLPAQFLIGVKSCRWPGRNQVIKNGPITYYLDGAHTPLSLQYCISWYTSMCRPTDYSSAHSNFQRILLFHCTSNRDPELFLPLIHKKCDFMRAFFCPPQVDRTANIYSDNSNFNSSSEETIVKVAENASLWNRLAENDSAAECFICAKDAIARIQEMVGDENSEVEVLVTGSLHLIGAILSIIDGDI